MNGARDALCSANEDETCVDPESGSNGTTFLSNTLSSRAERDMDDIRDRTDKVRARRYLALAAGPRVNVSL